MRSFSFLPFLAVLALLCFVNPARAQIITIADNLTSPNDVSGYSLTSSARAQQFTVTSGEWNLTAITAELKREPLASGVVARLYTDAANLVGAPLTTLALSGGFNAIPTQSFGNVTFTPNTPVVLTAGSSYWFALGPGQGASIIWAGSILNHNNNTGTAGTVNNLSGISNNSGVSYNNNYTDDYSFNISVRGAAITAVPEPSPLALLSTSLLPLGSLLLRKRRNRKA